MSQEVEFKDIEEMKRMLLKQYMDEYLKQTGLTAEEVALVEAKDDRGNKIFYFTKKTEKK